MRLQHNCTDFLRRKVKKYQENALKKEEEETIYVGKPPLKKDLLVFVLDFFTFSLKTNCNILTIYIVVVHTALVHH